MRSSDKLNNIEFKYMLINSYFVLFSFHACFHSFWPSKVLSRNLLALITTLAFSEQLSSKPLNINGHSPIPKKENSYMKYYEDELYRMQ